MQTKPLLDVQGLNAWYDRSHVVQDVSFHVNAGEIVTLMGRNGAFVKTCNWDCWQVAVRLILKRASR